MTCPFSSSELERLLDRPLRHLLTPADRSGGLSRSA